MKNTVDNLSKSSYFIKVACEQVNQISKNLKVPGWQYLSYDEESFKRGLMWTSFTSREVLEDIKTYLDEN